MPLNTTGPISIAGTTAGQSIQIELGGTGSSTMSLNDTNVRTLAGVPSGAIVMPTNFYGKSNSITTGLFFGGGIASGYINTMTRINACGAIIGTQTAVGTARAQLAGASASGTAVYFGGIMPGCCCCVVTNIVTRSNISGVIVGSETAIAGQARYQNAGAPVGSNHISYAGAPTGYDNSVIRINNSGALVGSVTTAGTARGYTMPAPVGVNGMYYGSNYTASNTVTRINACGALVGAQTAVGTARGEGGGAKVGVNGVFYGGANSQTQSALVTRINACGALVGSQTTVNPISTFLTGNGVGTVGVYYSGRQSTTSFVNNVNRINACGVKVGVTTNIGTARAYATSASL